MNNFDRLLNSLPGKFTGNMRVGLQPTLMLL